MMTSLLTLIWFTVGLLMALFSLFQQNTIGKFNLQDDISKVKSLRLYLAVLIVFNVILGAVVYVNTYITPISYPLFPFTLILLFMATAFGPRAGLLSFLISTPILLYFLVPPFGTLSMQKAYSEPAITACLSVFAGTIGGLVIRLYHRILGKRVDELQQLYWQTRSKLAGATGEQEILQAIDKASLAVASSEVQSLDNTFYIIANEVKELLGVYHVGIGLVQEDGYNPTVIINESKTNRLKSDQEKALYGIISRILDTKRISPVIVDIKRASQLVDMHRVFFPFDKILISPIFNGNTILGGVFVTNHKEKNEFSANDIKKINLFAAHAALAISAAHRYEELKTLIRMRDQFASVASHELKTPLSAIKLYTQLLQNKLSFNSDIHVEKSLSTINQEANKLTTLINTLLDFSRLQTGKFELDKTRFSLVEVCKHNVAVLQALNPNHTFEFKTPSISAPVLADRIRVEQVITNLLNNAARYSEPGTKITLELKRKEDHYVLGITDHGIGIDEQEQRSIFEPFFQAQEAVESKKAVHGMGLGLYISNRIIQKHGGKLWVESEKGNGSTFYLSLPARITKSPLHLNP